MPNNDLDLPDLTQWWPVPEGASLEDGDRYAIRDSNGDIVIYNCVDRWTPLPRETVVSERRLPRPLPAAEGTPILARIDGKPVCVPISRAGEVWRDDSGGLYRDASILSWTDLTDVVWNLR